MNPLLTKYGFTIGDEIVNIDPCSLNFKKKAVVIGFHLSTEIHAVYIKYLDGTCGHCTEEGKSYLRIKSIL